MKRILAAMLCFVMTAALFAGCGAQPSVSATASPAAEAPVRTAEAAQTSEAPGGTVRVSDVDGFLAAIAPGAVIELAPGTYDLTQASTYGRPTGSLYYRWADTYDGFTLQIMGVAGLTVRGSGEDSTKLVTQPRMAEVLALEGCDTIRLENFTAGHTVTGEACGGDVIRLKSCSDVILESMGIFGCGVTGVNAESSWGITLRNCDIYECSERGIFAWDVQQLAAEDCRFHSLGTPYGGTAVFGLFDSASVRIAGCVIADCTTTYLMECDSCTDVVLENNCTEDSAFTYAFAVNGTQPMSTGNVFEALNLMAWYADEEQPLTDEAGEAIPAEELEKAHESFVRETRQEIGNVEVRPVSSGSQQTCRVSTVDEFLRAIGPNKDIVLEAGLLLLEDAWDYGSAADTEWYYWYYEFDGPELVIRNVENMTIRAATDERKAHVISAVPRYADVLAFENCSGITLQGFTAGHTIEPGNCAGGVLQFWDCRDVLVDHCGLFGCGILGVNAFDTSGLQVKNCEIYECSNGGIQLDSCKDVEIGGCAYWELGGAAYSFSRCQSVTVDEEAVKGNYYGN